MKKKTREVLKPVKKIYIIGLSILAICITACTFHVLDIKRVYKKQSMQNLQYIMDIAMATLDDETVKLKNCVTEDGKGISDIEANSELGKYLNQLSEKYPEYSFAYVSEKSRLFGNANSLSSLCFGDYNSFSKISGSYYNNNYMCRILNIMDENGEDRVMLQGIQRIKRDVGGTFCYVIALKDITDIMEEQAYKYINKIAFCCIIDTKGEVFSKSVNYDDKVGENQKNVFDALQALTSGHSSEANKLKSESLKLGSDSEGNFIITTDSREEMYCCYARINTAKGYYFLACFNAGIVNDDMAGGAVRSFLICLFLMTVLFGVAFGMWIYMQSSNSLIEKLAFIDEVTGGNNFNYFKMKATEIISQNPESHFIMCRFDIMNFRYINEAYGHNKADDVLKACVQEFRKTFSIRELCVRVNSDQFLSLVLNDIDLSSRMQRYNKAVGDRAKENGVRYPIRFKTGLYQIKKEDRDIDVMIDHANAARKSIKNDNKVMEAYYSDSIISNMKKVDNIESEMQVSLGKEEFRVFLQPKWDIINDCIIGAEALVRWIKKDGSMYYPDEFIPVFEQNGFIEKLDFYMLERVCKKLKEIRQNGKYKIVPVSINQSRLLINNPDYVKSVERAMERYEMNVKDIELEITETVFLYEKDKMIDVANQLKDMGLTLAMDDFGSGYSSLNILKDIPFDILKIDKEFFDEAIASNQSIIILQKIIEMSEALGIEVICEGVETREQIDMLKDIGCKMVQGYYYGKPIPMDEFVEKYLKKDE